MEKQKSRSRQALAARQNLQISVDLHREEMQAAAALRGICTWNPWQATAR